MYIIQHTNPSYIIFAINDNVSQLTNDESLALEFETYDDAEKKIKDIEGEWIIKEKI
mgnify:FL=1